MPFKGNELRNLSGVIREHHFADEVDADTFNVVDVSGYYADGSVEDVLSEVGGELETLTATDVTLSGYITGLVEQDAILSGYITGINNDLTIHSGYITGLTSALSTHVLDIGNPHSVSGEQVAVSLTYGDAENTQEALNDSFYLHWLSKRNGFPNKNTDSTLSFVDGTRTLTISPTDTSYKVLEHSRYYDITGQDFVISADEGIHTIYYTSGVLTETTSFDAYENIIDRALVCYVYWDSTNSQRIMFGDERHGLMDSEIHYYEHKYEGARYYDGLSLNNMTVDGDGDVSGSAMFGVDAGNIADEDLEHAIDALLVPAQIPVYYREGENWRRDAPRDYPVKQGSSLLAWNEVIGTSGAQTDVDNLDFICSHIFATNDLDYPIVAFQGQAEYNNLGQVRAGAQTELLNLYSVGLPFAEFLPIASVIYQCGNGYDNIPKARIRSTDDGDDYIDWRDPPNIAGGGVGGTTSLAGGVITSTANFDKLLSSTDTTVQTALDTLDEIIDSAERDQIRNIDATTISAAQWGYVGGADQALKTTDSPTFAATTLTDGIISGANSQTLEIGDAAGQSTFNGSVQISNKIITYRESMYLNAFDDTGDSLIYIQNSNGTYKANLNVENDLDVGADLTVGGNLTVNGTTTTIDTVNLEVEDNFIIVNSNQTGTPPSTLSGGIEIERGDSANFFIAFAEDDDTLKIGEEGGLVAVAAREDTPTDDGIPYWDAATSTFKTTSTLTYAAGSLTIAASVPRIYFTDTDSSRTSWIMQDVATTEEPFEIGSNNSIVFTVDTNEVLKLEDNATITIGGNTDLSGSYIHDSVGSVQVNDTLDLLDNYLTGVKTLTFANQNTGGDPYLYSSSSAQYLDIYGSFRFNGGGNLVLNGNAIGNNAETLTFANGTDGTATFGGAVDLSSHKITSLISGTAVTDGVTKGQMDAAIAAAGGFADPMTTRGDLIYRGASDPTRLAIGTSGYVLSSNGTDPLWVTAPAGYTDTDAENVITAELVNGQSIDNAIDTLIATHASDADAHQAVYTDADAISAVEGEATLNLGASVTIDGCGSIEGGTTPAGTTAMEYNGYLYTTRNYNPVYSDFADHYDKKKDGIKIQYGMVYADFGEDAEICEKRNSKAVLGISTDTFGVSVGNPNGVPICMKGFVLAHVDKPYKPGTPLVGNKMGILTKAKFWEKPIAKYRKSILTAEWCGVKVRGRCLVQV